MLRVLRITCFLFLLVACAPAATPGAFFFYLRQGTPPTLVLLQNPDSRQPLDEIPLAPPPDCSFWSLTPAPTGPWAALEWQCPSGSLTQAVDTSTSSVQRLSSRKTIPLLDDPSVDSHFLAWSPDGKSVYLKAGALTNPQILRVDVVSRQTTVLPISPNTYNLTVSPSDGVIVWALTQGIGSGSQVWGADAQSISSLTGQLVLSDPAHIISLMRFSPDGKHIAAIRLPDDQTELPPGELWLADSDGKHAHFAATADAGRGMFPVWSPNGEKIAFIGRTHPQDPASINLSVLTLLDTRLSTFDLQLEAPPTWSPDGSRLYFTLASDGKMDVWFYEISTGKTEKMFENACCAGWTH